MRFCRPVNLAGSLPDDELKVALANLLSLSAGLLPLCFGAAIPVSCGSIYKSFAQCLVTLGDSLGETEKEPNKQDIDAICRCVPACVCLLSAKLRFGMFVWRISLVVVVGSGRGLFSWTRPLLALTVTSYWCKVKRLTTRSSIVSLVSSFLHLFDLNESRWLESERQVALWANRKRSLLARLLVPHIDPVI